MGKRNDEQRELRQRAKQVEEELAGLVDEVGAVRLKLPRRQHARILGNQYAGLVSQFTAGKANGKICTVVGDHAEAKQHFESAKAALMRLAALEKLVDEEGLRDEYDELVTVFLAEQNVDRAAEIDANRRANGEARVGEN